MTDRDPDDDVPRLVNPFTEPEPTEAMDRIEPAPTEPAPTVDATEVPTEAATIVSAPTEALPSPAAEAEPSRDSTVLDSLFGDDRFQEYQASREPQRRPPGERPASRASRAAEPRARGLTPLHRALLWIAGSVVAVLALIALFLFGLRLPGLLEPQSASTPTPTPTVTPTAPPVGPVAPGEYAWDELRGGECLEPFDDAWAEEFTVVDCAEPHAAQLVYRAVFAVAAPGVEKTPAPPVPFPGAGELQSQISLLCSAPGVVNLAAAGQYLDVQFQGTYPLTDEQWEEDPSYYCFVNRASGEPLTGSVAVPRPAP